MRAGITIFLLFFGVAVLDAVRHGQWPRVAFWILIGAVFFLLDQRGLFRRQS
jgi:hypothetical protein